nr:xylulose kinase-1 [Tanacetum cinerariifolium]
MAALRYRDEHNKVGYLLKPTGSDDYHQIIDFLRASYIRYALTHNLIIFDSLVKQLWSTATLISPKLGPPAIQATIDKTPYTITEDLVRSRLQLANDGGIDDLPIAEIYSGMDNLGPISVALICLSDGRRFNWSSYIFKGMVSNIGNSKKFLMYPRFLQAILGIDTRIKRQYKVLMFYSKLFTNMRLNFKGHPMPLLHAMLLQAPADPNTASFSQSHETDAGPFTNVEDEPLGGSFHMSLPRSTQAPLAGQPLGGAEDPITLTALSSVVSTLVQKVNSLETELKDYKKLFKDVVGKLVKKVKAMEVKLKTKKRKMVVSDSDQEDDGKQDVDLDALRALVNAAVTVDSTIPPGGASSNPAAVPIGAYVVPTGASAVPTGASAVPTGASSVPTGSLSVPPDVPPSVAHAGMEEDRLGEEAAKRLHDEEQAQVDKQRAELRRRRQQEVLDSAMYYTETNASLFKTLLGDDASEDNFPARMVALIKRKKQALAEKLAKERRNRPMTQAQQRAYMRQFIKNQSNAVQSNSQIQAFSKTLKRTGPVLEEPSSKRQKSTEALIPSAPEVSQSPVVSSHTSSGTRRKSLARKRLTKPKSTLQELDLDADAQTFIKVASAEDSDDEAPLIWSALVGWEVISTPLGDVNALYRIDQSTKHFTTLRQILHMVDRQDLVKLYGLVVQYYETHHVAGAGLILWGDLQVLFDSHKGGKGSCVWQHQHMWEIRSWRMYTLSNVHILETVFGEVLSMFADVSYPLSIKLMEKMLRHKLEIDKDVMGNDMTTAEQLVQFIKNQLAAAQVSSV